MFKVIACIKKPTTAVIISAVMAAIPLSFSELFFLSWIAFIPLFLSELNVGVNSEFRFTAGRWLLFGVLFNLCIYYWYIWLYPLDFLGLTNEVSLVVVLSAWLFTSVYHGVFFLIPGILGYIVGRKMKMPFLTVMAYVVGILIALKLTEYGELAFPWVRISLGQYRVPLLIQSASVWGVEGVDFLILLINALVALAIQSELPKRKIYIFVALSLFILNIVLGIFRLSVNDEGKEVAITVIQGNILVDEKWEGESAVESSYQRYKELTKSAMTDETQLVVWPETAVPINIEGSEKWQSRFKSLSAEIGVPIYMGVNRRLDGALFNSVVVFDENSISDACSKRILVPFGEKIPYRDMFAKYLSQVENLDKVFVEYTVDEGVQVMDTEFGRIGSIICFESIFPQFAREISAVGAEAFFVVTNDAWLEDSPATNQHLAHSVFRGVENSKPVVRCANVGVSAFVDGRGRIVSELKTLEKGTLSDKVSFTNGRTVYNTIGYVFFPLLIFIYFIACGMVYIRNVRSENKK